MLGDTTIEWARSVAKTVRATSAGSPRSEKMRLALVDAAFSILHEHYDPDMEKEEFLARVLGYLENYEARDLWFPGRSIASLFDTVREDG